MLRARTILVVTGSIYTLIGIQACDTLSIHLSDFPSSPDSTTGGGSGGTSGAGGNPNTGGSGGTPSQCGNDALEPGEECEDGNGYPYDGCEGTCDLNGECISTCKVTAGFVCQPAPAPPGTKLSTCQPDCGDGQIRGTEICDGDDGQAPQNFDYCDTSCEFVPVVEVEPNGSIAEAKAIATANKKLDIDSDRLIRGDVTSSGKDVFRLELKSPAIVRMETFSTLRECSGNTLLDITYEDGNTIRHDDNSGINDCAEVTLFLDKNMPYYVAISTSNSSENYFLEINVQQSSDPNATVTLPSLGANVTGTAMIKSGSYASDIFANGTIVDNSKEYYAVYVPDGKSLRAEMVPNSAQSAVCSNAKATLSLLSASNPPVTLAVDKTAGTMGADTDTGFGNCVKIDGTGMSGPDVGAHNMKAGLYFLEVAGVASPQATYALDITVR